MFHRFHTGTWQRRPSGRVPTHFIPVRVARATVTMAVLRICALLLLFDCQEAFHCCLVVACINRINMISIECHRSGERCPGKREFDNRIEINRVRSVEIMWLFPLMVTMALSVSISKLQPSEICVTSILTSPGHSRSKPMAPFERSSMTSYSTLMVTMALFCKPFQVTAL